MRKKLFAVVVGGVLGLFGCGAVEEEVTQFEYLNQPVIGGEPTADYPAVMAIFGRVPGQDAGALCTATLITPKLLLTAAHCVTESLIGEGAEWVAIRGSDLKDKTKVEEVIKVTEVHAHSKFNSSSPANGYDIGVAILEKELDITPYPYQTTALDPAIKGNKVRVVGYGASNGFDQQNTAGTKRTTELTLQGIDTGLVSIGDSGKNICVGDSGGPVFYSYSGKPTVIGVNSFGMIFCLGNSSSTRVDRYLDFLKPYLGQ